MLACQISTPHRVAQDRLLWRDKTCPAYRELGNILTTIVMLVYRWGFRGWSKGCTMVSVCRACCMLLHESEKPSNWNQNSVSLSVTLISVLLFACPCACVWHSLLVWFLWQRPMLATCFVVSGVIEMHHSDIFICCCNEHGIPWGTWAVVTAAQYMRHVLKYQTCSLAKMSSKALAACILSFIS